MNQSYICWVLAWYVTFSYGLSLTQPSYSLENVHVLALLLSWEANLSSRCVKLSPQRVGNSLYDFCINFIFFWVNFFDRFEKADHGLLSSANLAQTFFNSASNRDWSTNSSWNVLLRVIEFVILEEVDQVCLVWLKYLLRGKLVNSQLLDYFKQIHLFG